MDGWMVFGILANIVQARRICIKNIVMLRGSVLIEMERKKVISPFVQQGYVSLFILSFLRAFVAFLSLFGSVFGYYIMGCNQSSETTTGSATANPGAVPNTNRKYISQKSARSTLKPTARKDGRKNSITGWCIMDIDEYYEGVDSTETKTVGWTSQSELGSGNFGKVYRAKNKEKGYMCALKKILMTDKHNTSSVETLRREVNILQDMLHPSIIRLYETLETSTHLYISQEMCTGGELFDAIIQSQNEGVIFDECDAAAVMRMALEGLEHCHDRDVVHRDLKPENFLLSIPLDKKRKHGDPFPQVKMIDFGLAEKHRYGEHFQLRAGTPYYMAPEVLNKSYDLECDLWSMGVILYILLCGYPPFYGDNDEEIYERIEKGLPRTFPPAVEAWLKQSGETVNAAPNEQTKLPGNKKYKHNKLLQPSADVRAVWDEYAEFFPEAEFLHVSAGAIDLIRKLLVKNPKKRLTAKQALKHPWILAQGPPKPEPLNKKIFDNLRQFTGLDKFKKVTKKLIALKLPQSEIDILANSFKEADTDKNGILTADELRVVVQNHLSSMKKSTEDIDEEFAQLIQALDIDGDGTIGYEEFIAATMETKHWDTAGRLEEAFACLDTDGSHYLETEEVAKALGESDANAQDILKRFDANGDGKIDLSEFKAMMHEHQGKSQRYMSKQSSQRTIEGQKGQRMSMTR